MKIKKLVIGLVLLISLLCFTGCNQTYSGYIIDKQYKPSQTKLITTILNKTPKLLPIHTAEQYIFILDNNDSVKVTEDIYNSYEIGDYFTNEN